MEIRALSFFLRLVPKDRKAESQQRAQVTSLSAIAIRSFE